jgi:hypothetical protein
MWQYAIFEAWRDGLLPHHLPDLPGDVLDYGGSLNDTFRLLSTVAAEYPDGTICKHLVSVELSSVGMIAT